MSAPYKDKVEEDRRYLILRFTSKGNGSANENTVHAFLNDMGHTVSGDVVKTDIAWLREQGLVDSENRTGTLVFWVTDRGAEVGRGQTTSPGVRKPRPSERKEG